MLKHLTISFIAAFVLMNSARAEEKLIPVDAFVEQEKFNIPHLSPDGKHIAVSVRIKREKRNMLTMVVYTLPELKIVATHILPGFEVPVNFFWVNNQRLAIKKGLEVGYREPPVSTGEIIATNIDGTQVEYLYGYQNFKQSKRGERYGDDYAFGVIADVPYSRNGNIMVSSHEWRRARTNLYEINTNTAVRRLVADISMPDLDFTFQHDGKARFASGYDDNNKMVLFRFDDQAKEWQRTDSSKLGSHFSPLVFLPGDDEFYALQSNLGEPDSLIIENMNSGQRKVLFKDPVGSVEQIEFSAKPEIPFAITSSVGIPKAVYIMPDAPDAKLHKILSESFPDSYVHFINFSDDGQKLLFNVSSDRDPGSFYIYDRQTGKADLLFLNMSGLEPDQMASRKPIDFITRDGEKIMGYLTVPNNPQKKKLPLILLPHGGPIDIHDGWYFDRDAQFLASRGYAVLQVNFRGSSGRGPKFRDAGMKEFGGKMIDDLVDGLKWANTLPEIDSQRVCVYGASYGAYAAMMVPVKAPSLVRCAVGYSGRYDLVSRYSQDVTKESKKVENWLRKYMGDDMNKLASESPVNLAEKIKVPVFLAHGTKDEKTELGQAENMRRALQNAGNDPEWLLIKNEGHGFYDSEHQKEFYMRLETFLKKHLGS